SAFMDAQSALDTEQDWHKSGLASKPGGFSSAKAGDRRMDVCSAGSCLRGRSLPHALKATQRAGRDQRLIVCTLQTQLTCRLSVTSVHLPFFPSTVQEFGGQVFFL